MGNDTIHAPRLWYNNRKALLYQPDALTGSPPKGGNRREWAMIPFTLRVHGIISARQILYQPDAPTPQERRDGQLYHSRSAFMV